MARWGRGGDGGGIGGQRTQQRRQYFPLEDEVPPSPAAARRVDTYGHHPQRRCLRLSPASPQRPLPPPARHHAPTSPARIYHWGRGWVGREIGGGEEVAVTHLSDAPASPAIGHLRAPPPTACPRVAMRALQGRDGGERGRESMTDGSYHFFKENTD